MSWLKIYKTTLWSRSSLLSRKSNNANKFQFKSNAHLLPAVKSSEFQLYNFSKLSWNTVRLVTKSKNWSETKWESTFSSKRWDLINLLTSIKKISQISFWLKNKLKSKKRKNAKTTKVMFKRDQHKSRMEELKKILWSTKLWERNGVLILTVAPKIKGNKKTLKPRQKHRWQLIEQVRLISLISQTWFQQKCYLYKF